MTVQEKRIIEKILADVGLEHLEIETVKQETNQVRVVNTLSDKRILR